MHVGYTENIFDGGIENLRFYDKFVDVFGGSVISIGGLIECTNFLDTLSSFLFCHWWEGTFIDKPVGDVEETIDKGDIQFFGVVVPRSASEIGGWFQIVEHVNDPVSMLIVRSRNTGHYLN